MEKTFANLDQRELNSILSLYGADGFVRADGELSRKLADMREGGTYALVVPARPSLAQEVSPLYFACGTYRSAPLLGSLCEDDAVNSYSPMS